jgi:predicted Zn-dependent protease
LTLSGDALRTTLVRRLGQLEHDPGNPSLVLEIADLRTRLGEFDEAETLLLAALAQGPADPRLQSQLATTYIASARPEKAIQLMQPLVAPAEAHPALRYNLAYALLLAHRAAEARDQLLAALDHREAVPETRLLLARALHHCGDVEEAEKHIEAYLADHAGDAEALGTAALIHYDANHPERARETARQALRADTHDLGALVTLGSLALGEQNRAAAEDYFTRAVARHPTSGRARSGMGLTAMLGLDFDRAFEQLERAVQEMPGHVGTWHSLAWCQILKGDLAGAERSLGRAMALNRNFGETHGGLAVVHVLQGKADVAEGEVKRALRLDPTCFSGRFAQSLLLQKSDPGKAKAIVRGIMSSSVVEGGEKLQDMLRRTLSGVLPLR